MSHGDGEKENRRKRGDRNLDEDEAAVVIQARKYQPLVCSSNFYIITFIYHICQFV